ncbi:hypothetical protein Tco_1507842 [Tanacetum coccineum]
MESAEPTYTKAHEHAEFDESNANVLERFYTSARNPVKEILHKLNLPDHRILKDGGEGAYYCLAEIIAINLYTSSDNNNSDFDNNTLDSASTSQINTSEKIDYDSLEYKGPPKSLLKWYGYLSDDSDAKPSFSDISKAKACQRLSYKDHIKPSLSKAQVHPVPITNCVLGLANAETWNAILSKTFGVKIPPIMAYAKEKKGKRKISMGS